VARRLLPTILSLLFAALAPAQAQMLDRIWARFLPRCESFAISADGSAVVASEWDGGVQAHAQDGHVLWRVKFPAQVVCLPSNGAALSVAFTPKDAGNRKVYFLDRAGKVIRTEIAPGAVQTAALSSDGTVVVILSEPGRVTALRRTMHGWKWQRRLLPGIVSSLAMDAAGTRIAVAHRDPTGIVIMSSQLRTLWRFRGQKRTTYRLQLSSNGAYLSALSVPPPGQIAVTLFWRTDNTTPLWKHTLRGDLARVQLAADGLHLAAGYRTRLWHGQKSTIEARVTLFSQEGRRSWEVGGLMFGAQLIGATPSPLLVLTHDGNRVLAALDVEGHMRARHRLASPVRLCAMAREGTHLAVLSEARVLYLFCARK
jgi:hypothetical protein